MCVCRWVSSVSMTCDSPAHAARCTRRRFTAHYRFHTLASRSIRRAEPIRRSGVERNRAESRGVSPSYRVPYRYVTPRDRSGFARGKRAKWLFSLVYLCRLPPTEEAVERRRLPGEVDATLNERIQKRLFFLLEPTTGGTPERIERGSRCVKYWCHCRITTNVSALSWVLSFVHKCLVSCYGFKPNTLRWDERNVLTFTMSRARVWSVRRCTPAEMSNDEDVGPCSSSSSNNSGSSDGGRNGSGGRRSRGSVT